MNEKVFRSKIGLGLAIPLFIIIGGSFVTMLVANVWIGAIVIGCVALFALHLFSTNYYTVSGNVLYVKSSFLINKTIDIGSITKITPTRNILSSPALSLDRLEIFYNKYDSIMISPNDKAGFIDQLKGINAGIEVIRPT